MTPEGDILVFCKSEFVIENRRMVLLALNSSKEFARLENEGKTTRYDWIEELDNNKFGHENGDQDVMQAWQRTEKERNYISEPEQLTFRTILWLPVTRRKILRCIQTSKVNTKTKKKNNTVRIESLEIYQ